MIRKRDRDATSAGPNGVSGFYPSGLVPFRNDPWRSPLEVVALVGVVGSFWVVAESTGLVAGIAIVLSWYVLPAVGVFAAGVVVLTGLSGRPVVFDAVGLPAVALFGLLLLTVLGTGPRRDVAILLLSGAVLSGIAAAIVAETGALWPGGVALLIVAAIGYVSVDLVTLSRARSATSE